MVVEAGASGLVGDAELDLQVAVAFVGVVNCSSDVGLAELGAGCTVVDTVDLFSEHLRAVFA